MKKRRRFVAMLSLLVAVLSPFEVAAQECSSAPVRLFDLTTAHGIVDEKPFQPVRVFGPNNDVVYLWYAAEGCAIGTRIRSVWLYLETDPPSTLAEASVVVDRPGTWGQFNFRLAPGKRWAIGRYRIELRVKDEVIAETDFDVSARTTVRWDQSQPIATETWP